MGPVQRSSPSAHKPQPVVQDWLRVFGDAVELVSFEPVSQQQLARAHHRDFVEEVLNGSISNGFGNRDRKVALSLHG